MECKFQVGDKVVCVDADVGDVVDLLKEGQIYTVAAVRPNSKGYIGVELIEIQPTGGYAGYHYWRFRPAEDIEQFRRLVADLPINLELAT